MDGCRSTDSRPSQQRTYGTELQTGSVIDVGFILLFLDMIMKKNNTSRAVKIEEASIIMSNDNIKELDTCVETTGGVKSGEARYTSHVGEREREIDR